MVLLLKLISFVLSKLSPAGLERLAKGMTFLVWDILRIRRALILKNLDIAFHQEKTAEERLSIGRQSIFHFVMTILEFLSERNGQLGRHVSIAEGEKHLKAAMDEGRGAYILCIHMGNWEAMGSGLTKAGYPSHVIVKKVGSEAIDDFVRQRRHENGFFCIRRQKKGDAVKGIRQVLKNGGLVGFVMDQARPGEPALPFFGQPAKTNTSFAAILGKIPAPVIPAYIRRTGVHQHEIHIKEALKLSYSDSAHATDIQQQSEYFNSVVESMIRECPEQYFWMHNRWKH
ncbi:MAG: lysophospholipid acyltransferase family protein [Deltaproteobacteria bacterium]|nr:lysophospholipid acyltransferase family protein [Deltaproteobacteria bacterium]